MPDGQTTLVVATEGISIGSSVAIGDNVSLRPGNITSITNIPEGTAINNLELRPGDGGKVARTAGNSAFVEAHLDNGKVRVRLPSGTTRDMSGKCRATIGVLAGHGRGEMPLELLVLHITRLRQEENCPHVSGVAMNPVDHPHGGGNHQVVQQNSVARDHLVQR